MTNAGILFAGCSHAESSGFLPENLDQHHWARLLTAHYGCASTNIARGGMSNTEIFLRTVEQVNKQRPNLVIVMWSEIARDWVYYNQCNVDDFTNINYGGTNGAFANVAEVQLYAKMHCAYFTNLYVKIKHWLLNVLALEGFLQSRGIPFVFVKGFDNYVSEFQQLHYNEHGMVNLTQDLKRMLDFDNRTDSYLIQKIHAIKDLLASVDRKHWIDFDHYSFMHQSLTDFADDGGHPGPLSNRDITNKLIEHIDSMSLTFAPQTV